MEAKFPRPAKLNEDWFDAPAGTLLTVHARYSNVQDEPILIVSRQDGEKMACPSGTGTYRAHVAESFISMEVQD